MSVVPEPIVHLHLTNLNFVQKEPINRRTKRVQKWVVYRVKAVTTVETKA